MYPRSQGAVNHWQTDAPDGVRSIRELRCYRAMVRLVLLVLILLTVSSQAIGEVREGDIIFQTSLSGQSQAVQRATRSKYSHVGLILYKKGKPFVFEAVNPVKYTPLDQWIKSGKGGHYVVKRIKNAETVLDAGGVQKLYGEAAKFEGRPYDLTFEWSNERIYCSELVWKIYESALGVEVGKPQKLREFNLTDPVVKQKLMERYGAKVPLDETVISPEAIFSSPELVTISSN